MSDKESAVFNPIGWIRTPFEEQQGTPIQPAMAGDIPATVELLAEFREGLADLSGFERIWLLYWMDRSRPCRLKVVPYLDTVQRGLFATRAPSRPNPIGISCVRLTSVDLEQGLLHILGADILNGTPLLDIKPYVPRFDAFPESRKGWLEDIDTSRVEADRRFSRE